MVTDGVKVYHSGKAVVLRRVFQIMATGASMCVLALIEKTVELRGHLIVVRPFAGDQTGRRKLEPHGMGAGDIVENWECSCGR